MEERQTAPQSVVRRMVGEDRARRLEMGECQWTIDVERIHTGNSRDQGELSLLILLEIRQRFTPYPDSLNSQRL